MNPPSPRCLMSRRWSTPTSTSSTQSHRWPRETATTLTWRRWSASGTSWPGPSARSSPPTSSLRLHRRSPTAMTRMMTRRRKRKSRWRKSLTFTSSTYCFHFLRWYFLWFLITIGLQRLYVIQNTVDTSGLTTPRGSAAFVWGRIFCLFFHLLVQDTFIH